MTDALRYPNWAISDLTIDTFQNSEYTIIRNSEKSIVKEQNMLVEMRARSQITLPNEVIKKLGISEGDKFEVEERDGGVFLCPVVVYPKAKLEQLAKIMKEHKKKPSAVFESVEDMFKDIGIDLQSGNV